MKWLKENKIAQKGLPCQSCQACNEHKKCKRCKGKGRVKKTKTDFKKVDIDTSAPIGYYVIDSKDGHLVTVKGK
jgi:DnaJ-class molecular chaperone